MNNVAFNKAKWARKDYARHPERYRAYAQNYYYEHRGEILERARNSHSRKLLQREYQYLSKMKVLMQYSNPMGNPICNNCGERDFDVLCIDHIQGGGIKHRKEVGCVYYLWLIKNNYPEGYQVLCANCNMKKGKLEYIAI